MAESFNRLTPAQAERLALLLEELGEAQQAIGKILRHGYSSTNPDIDEGEGLSNPSNREALQRELGDVLAAVELLTRAGDLSGEAVEYSRTMKLFRVRQYLHHQTETTHG